MDKLQYDSLYKFLVSLGIILIALPIAAVVYLLNRDLVLISQVDFDALSEYSQQIIKHRSLITSCFMRIFPWLCASFVCLGIFLLVYGLCKWKSVQKNLDKKLDAETTMQTLALMGMSNKEIEAKIETEVKEDMFAVTNNEMSSAMVDSHFDTINRIKEIEDLCFRYFSVKYSKDYSFRQNIFMGKYEYDLIGVSKTNNVDLIVEIKYWETLSIVVRRLCDVSYRLYDAGKNYETIAHRNFRPVVVIITSKELLPQMEHQVEVFLQRLNSEKSISIEIKCIAEEAL